MKKKLLMLLAGILPVFFVFTGVKADDTIDIVFDNAYAHSSLKTQTKFIKD